MASNQEIAAFLNELSILLELRGENAFRIRAYTNAARTFEMLEENISAMLQQGTLTSLKGVGQGLADLVEEFVRTGTAADLEEAKASIPAGLLDMLKIPGLGPKKIRTIHTKLGLENLQDLERACAENLLSDLSGFGKKTQENIIKGIEHLRHYQERWRADEALQDARALRDALAQNPHTIRVEIAGSLRRYKETVKDIDLVISTARPEAVAQTFIDHPSVAQVVARGQTKTTVLLASGIQADLRLVADAHFPCILHHFTGSKEHNIALRARAQSMGLRLNEYGLLRASEELQCKDEAALFAHLDLSYIPPEMREGLGEVEAAAAGTLPELVDAADIRGMLHLHSTYSDGRDSIESMALAVRQRGYAYMGISDHSRSAAYAGGLREDDILRQHDEIDALNDELEGIHIFKGIESDILPDGALDYEDALLERFDFIVASVHSRFNMSEREMTRRLVRAIEHPSSTILGHLSGRLLLEREGYPVDIDALTEAAAAHDVAIEINANPHRLDIDWRHLRSARDRGVKIALNTDAHRIEGLDHLHFGIGAARKGWLRREDIINTLDTGAIAAYFAKL